MLCTLATFLLAATTSFVQSPKPSAQQTPPQEFAHAKNLIQNNCIDCEGGTQAGMESGIKEMKEAIAAGYSDKIAAYKLLDDGYAAMETYSGKDPKQSAAYTAERAQSIHALYQLAPNNADVIERYSDYVKDDAEKAKLLRRVVELDPTRTGARYQLGLITAKTNVAEGMTIVEQAIIQGKNDEATITYVQGLIEIMQTHGCAMPNANIWFDKVQSAYDRATSGAGDPKAMPAFKNDFLAAVRQQHCSNAATK